MTKINKKNITMTIRPDVYEHGRQIAKEQNRSFANFVECLMMDEIEKARKAGIKLE